MITPSPSGMEAAFGETEALCDEKTVFLHFSLRVSQTAARKIDAIAADRGVSRSGLALAALGFLQAMDDATREGLYVGATRDRGKLDAVFLTPRRRTRL
jgi:hypothetical protein